MKLFAFTNPKPGRDDEFNEWYNTIHRADLLSVPGIVGMTRYRVRPTGLPGAGEGSYQYLAVYDLDGDFETIVNGLGKRSQDGSMRISDALDVQNTLMVAYEPI